MNLHPILLFPEHGLPVQQRAPCMRILPRRRGASIATVANAIIAAIGIWSSGVRSRFAGIQRELDRAANQKRVVASSARGDRCAPTYPDKDRCPLTNGSHAVRTWLGVTIMTRRRAEGRHQSRARSARRHRPDPDGVHLEFTIDVQMPAHSDFALHAALLESRRLAASPLSAR